MKKLKLKNSDFTIPAMGQGMMGIGGYFERDSSKDSHSIDILQKGFEKGLTFVDTAEIYGAGHSEEVLGLAVKDCRSKVQIGTKFSPENSSPKRMIEACKCSLERLKTDYIDLYQTHWPSNDIKFESTLDGFNSLLKEGLIKYVGLSNATLKQVRLAKEKLPVGRFVSLQQAFNLADRFAEENFLPACQKEGRLMIAYSPLMEGKLVPNDNRKDKIQAFASKLGLTLPQLILAWLISYKNINVIPKSSSLKHMVSNIKAWHFKLPEEIIFKIENLYKSNVARVNISDIDITKNNGRKVYQTIEEAIENKNRMNPSPLKLSEDFKQGEIFRPIKVSNSPHLSKPYSLSEGGLRYWAWRIAFGEDSKVEVNII